MQISVDLQDMFSYSPVVIFIILFLFFISMVIMVIKKRKHKMPKRVPVKQPVKPKNTATIKQKYQQMLSDLEKAYLEDQLSERLAYQELSRIIRHFVHEVTGKEVQNYTLTEIGQLNMPNLYEAIVEYYVPEFATESKSDLQNSITKARRVIEEWN